MARMFNVAVIGLFLLLLVGANAAYSDSGAQSTVENESITVDYSQSVAVDEDADEYGDDPTVRNSNGTILTAGTDYEWDATNGSVTWYNTSETTDGETAAITYETTDRSEATKASKNILTVLGGGIWVVLFGTLILGAFRLSTGGASGGGL